MTFTKSRHPLDSAEGRLSEHLPWLMQVTPELVLNKDGSVMGAFELTGVDYDDPSGFELQKALSDLQASLQTLDERYYLWVITDKRYVLEPEQVSGLSSNLVTELIAERNRARYASGNVFTFSTYIFLMFTGDTGVYRFMDNVRQRMTEEGASLSSAILYALNPANSTKSAALYDARQLDLNIQQAEAGLSAFMHAHTALGLRRLAASELNAALYRSANPTLSMEYDLDLQPGTMLDASLAASDIRFGRELFAVHGPDRTQYGYTVSLNGYPNNANSLSVLATLPAEFRIVHAIRCMSLEASRNAVQEYANYYEMNLSNWRQQVVGYVNNASPEVDQGMSDLLAQCNEALRRNTSEGLGFVYHSCSISFYADTSDQAKRLADNVIRSIGGLPIVRERLGLKSAVLSTIPGQWAYNKRMMLANTELVGNMLPVRSVPAGSSRSRHLSSGEVYGRTMPALATFASRLGTEVHFDPFVGQVAHSLVVIPTGGGKTTFVNYCLSCFSRYPNAQVLIFDRDYSCRIVTELAGGQHVDMRTGMKLNPLAHIRESDIEVVWATDFIVRRVEESGERLTAEQRKEIHDRIRSIAQNDSMHLSLNALYSLLSSDIQIKLSEWVNGGPFSYFGSEDDHLEFSRWTCIEMKEILKVNRLSRAFLDHAFSSIARKLDGRPTFIYVEEASFALRNKSFLAGITDWLQTFRKKNAFVWLTIQSPESVSGIDSEELKATIADNIPNLILGANTKLEQHRPLYRTMFGLTDDQIDMIGKLQPKREYLRVTSDICRVMSTSFDHHVLAAIRSEPPYQELFDQIRQSGRDDWRSAYLRQATERSKL